MLKKINIDRQWRMIATGICFLTFIGGSFVLTLTALPIILFSSSKKDQIEIRVLKLIRFCFKFFMQYMKALGLMSSFNTEGFEEIKSLEKCIFIANHPTLIDVVVVIGCLPLCHCIVKKALLEHFYFGGLMRAAGYIANDHATQLIQDCHRSFQSGRSLLIFPEGTRSPAYGLRPFNRGAAQIALRTGAPVIPIVITCEPSTLLKGEPWYAVPEQAFSFTVRFHPPLAIPQAIRDKPGIALQVRALNQYFEEFFHHHLQSTDASDTATHPYQA